MRTRFAARSEIRSVNPGGQHQNLPIGVAEITLDAAIRRNIFREEAAPDTGVAHVAQEMRAHAASLAELSTPALLSGRAPW